MIKTYKRLLIWFLVEKGNIIDTYLRSQRKNPYTIRFLVKEDFDEIGYEWSEEECQKVLEKIINRSGVMSDGDICPWCIRACLVRETCNSCKYGRRHGDCNKNNGSDYQIITCTGHPPIKMYELSGMDSLLSKLAEQYRELKNPPLPKLTENDFQDGHYYVIEWGSGLKDVIYILDLRYENIRLHETTLGKLITYCGRAHGYDLLSDKIHAIKLIVADITSNVNHDIVHQMVSVINQFNKSD